MKDEKIQTIQKKREKIVFTASTMCSLQTGNTLKLGSAESEHQRRTRGRFLLSP